MKSYILEKDPDIKEFYDKVGFGGRCGFGKRPAIIVIDLAKAWTDPSSSMGTDLTEAINNTNRILGVARQTNPKIPIYFTVVSFDPSFKEFSEVRRLKRPGPMKYLASGSEWLELESSLERQPDEPLLKKKHASCFYQTTLTEMLVNETVDTLIITGCSTAGCVRATAQDAFQYGLHTIVPAGAVGDRNSARHKWALVDIDVMWGDVVTTEDVLNYLNQFK